MIQSLELSRRRDPMKILISLALSHYVHPNWIWLTAFVGANLLQSAFTGFCPAETILKKLGVGGSCCGKH